MDYKILSRLMIILAFFFAASASSFADDYSFLIEVDHDFDDDEEIKCVIEYDGKEKNWNFDEDSDSDDFEYEKDFEEYVNLDCDDELDEIYLEIYDERTNKRIDELEWENEDGFEYELEAVDKDENWFEIEIDHDFGNNEEIECELTIDFRDFDYEFSDDTEKKDFTITKNFDEEFSFDCEDDIDEISLEVYDDDGKLIYENDYEDRDYFDFNIEDSGKLREVRIDIDHNFDRNEEISCDLELDSDDESFDFDSSSSASDLNFIREFAEDVYFDCSDDFDDMYITIYDANGDRIESFHYENEDRFEYEFSSGEYEFLMKITDEFEDDKEVECELFLDGIESSGRFDFDDKSSISDLFIQKEFNKNFELECDEELELVEVSIYLADEDDVLDEVKYTNTDVISYTYPESSREEEPQDQQSEPVEEEEEEVVEPSNGDNKSEDPVLDVTPIENVTGENSDVIGSEGSANGQNEQPGSVVTSPNKNQTPDGKSISNGSSKGLKKFFLILLGVVLVVSLFTFAMKKLSGGNKSSGRPPAHIKRVEKKDIDFSFLNKKK